MGYEPDDESWSAAAWLGAYANAMYNEYLDYWELQNVPKDSQLSDFHRTQFRIFKELADTLTPCLHSLTVSSEVLTKLRAWLESIGANEAAVTLSSDAAAKIARAIYSHQIVRDGIQIDLALHASDNLLAGAEVRAASLIALVANRSLSDRAAAFLDRATRLFLWGFEPECVVMCASVLEAAYEQRFPPEEMFRLQIQKKGIEFAPYEYEQAAVAAGIFSLQDKKLAATLRRSRNDTLHNVPSLTLNAREALTSTAALLTRLFPRFDRKRPI